MVPYPDNTMLFRAKKNEQSNHEKTWRQLNCILPSGGRLKPTPHSDIRHG